MYPLYASFFRTRPGRHIFTSDSRSHLPDHSVLYRAPAYRLFYIQTNTTFQNFMRQDGFPPDRQAGLAGCFSRVTHPRQTEILGAIAVEILRQDRKITRITVCLKLIGRLDAAGDEADAGHLRELIGMLFRK